MWIERFGKKDKFIRDLLSLRQQVLLVHGARQVGKTSFILNALEGLQSYPQVRVNLSLQRSTQIQNLSYFGRDFFFGTNSEEE